LFSWAVLHRNLAPKENFLQIFFHVFLWIKRCYGINSYRNGNPILFLQNSYESKEPLGGLEDGVRIVTPDGWGRGAGGIPSKGIAGGGTPFCGLGGGYDSGAGAGRVTDIRRGTSITPFWAIWVVRHAHVVSHFVRSGRVCVWRKHVGTDSWSNSIRVGSRFAPFCLVVSGLLLDYVHKF
jgi:hypothetical protein